MSQENGHGGHFRLLLGGISSMGDFRGVQAVSLKKERNVPYEKLHIGNKTVQISGAIYPADPIL